MPGIAMEGDFVNVTTNELNASHVKGNSDGTKSTETPLSPERRVNRAIDRPVEGCVDTSTDQLYENASCAMESSIAGSPLQKSSASGDGNSRIDSELHRVVSGDLKGTEIVEEKVDSANDRVAIKKNVSAHRKTAKTVQSRSASIETSSVSPKKSKNSVAENEVECDMSTKSMPKASGSCDVGIKVGRKPSVGVPRIKKQDDLTLRAPKEPRNGDEDLMEAGLDNPDLGPFLLKHARDLISTGDNLQKALKYATRAARSFEICAGEKPSLDLVMSLHVIAAIHCSLKEYDQAIPVLEQAIKITVLEEGNDHALAKFSGYMQLGDTYSMLGHLESSIQCYTAGLQVQKQALGHKDPRVGETCRYLAEAHMQAMQFEEAEQLCRVALDIHKEQGEPGSLEETADRRLLGLICDTKGDYENALEHLVLVSMAMMSNGQEADVASVDCSIGDTYLSLARYDEAAFAYQKALTVFKSTKGENHPVVASVFVRLADLYNKTGKIRESMSYCESALRIYGKPLSGTSAEEIASGLTDISAIYDSINEPEQALKLLEKALKIYNDFPGRQCTMAAIEAQMGVLYYTTKKYTESYNSSKNAIEKLRACGDKKSAFFGYALNQMGLACAQLCALNDAAELFEEARSIFEQECGPYHPDTLGIYSNLAGAYDAMGRVQKAIEILEYVVAMREEKLGTANSDVVDEKRRLAELLNEAGTSRHRKTRSLENLLDANSHPIKIDAITS